MTMKPLVFVFALLALVVLIAEQSALASREMNEKPQTQGEMNKQAQPQGFGGGYPGQGGGSYYPGHGGGGSYYPGHGGGGSGGGGGSYYPGHGGGGGGFYCKYRCGFYHRCCSAAEYHAELAKANGKGN